MDDLFKLISTFIDAVALIMALVLMLSLLHRKGHPRRGRSALLGFMFSFAIVVSMSDPIDLGPNGFFDMRGLLVGTAAALMGPVVGLMAAATALIYRLIIGGPGLESGIALIAGAFFGGWCWRLWIKNTVLVNWKKSIILGLFISAQAAGIFFAPPHMQWNILTGLVPYIVISNVLGALLINHLLSGELSFLSQAETSKIEAGTDHLTGLINRRGLNLLYPDLKTSSSPNKGRAVLYFDIDRFKQTNDTHGHGVGDAVLQQLANRVAGNLRQNDVFARMGGDEFAVVLPQVDMSEAQHIADRCRSIVAEDVFTVDDKDLAVTISLGGIFVKTPTEIDPLLDAADRALYQAKASGRNAVVFLADMAKQGRSQGQAGLASPT